MNLKINTDSQSVFLMVPPPPQKKTVKSQETKIAARCSAVIQDRRLFVLQVARVLLKKQTFDMVDFPAL